MMLIFLVIMEVIIIDYMLGVSLFYDGKVYFSFIIGV